MTAAYFIAHLPQGFFPPPIGCERLEIHQEGI